MNNGKLDALVTSLSHSSGLRAAADAIDADLDARQYRGAKPGPRKAARKVANGPARERFQECVKRLDACGWSWQDIGNYLGCSKQNVMSVFHGSTNVAAYMLDMLDMLPELAGLPSRMRAQQLRRTG